MQKEEVQAERFLQYSRVAFRRIHGLPVVDIASNDPDFQELLPIIRKHRMQGILYAGFGGHATRNWNRQALALAQQSARYTHEALRIHHALSQAISPPPILIKGPGLAAQAWPQPALRTFDDFDFRCRITDYQTFFEVVRASGYQPLVEGTDHNKHLWHFGWGVTFRHPDGYFLEVNHRLFPPHYPCPVGIGPSGRALPVSELLLDGENTPLPTPAAHLVLASAHALWHGGERLAWIADIAGLLTRHPDSITHAQPLCGKHTFLRKSLITACLLADQLFGPDLPGWKKSKADLQKQINPQMLATCATYRSQLMAPTPPNRTERRRLQRPLCNAWEKIRAVTLQTVTPGDPDFSRLCLKPQNRNRYWLYRPLRILRERIRTTVQTTDHRP